MDDAEVCRLRSVDWRYQVVTGESLSWVEMNLTGFAWTDLGRIARRSSWPSLQFCLERVEKVEWDLPRRDVLVSSKLEATLHLGPQ